MINLIDLLDLHFEQFPSAKSFLMSPLLILVFSGTALLVYKVTVIMGDV
jgi:hypothetical protein